MFKKIFKLILVLVVLGLILLSLFLGAAHLQVRSVAPELPSESELLSLLNESGPIKVGYILTSSQTLARGKISHTSIVLEWADGRLFMIDAGMDEVAAKDFASLLKKIDSSASDGNTLGTVASFLGRDIERVQGVGFTHLHIDHTQGVDVFCQSRGEGALVLQSTVQARLHNFNTTEGADIIKNSCLKLREFNAEKLNQFDDFPGIGAFALGGHTPGSTLWAVGFNNKVLLFSGDITNDKLSIDHNEAKPALYSYVLVPENVKRTAELRKWLLSLDKKERFSVIVSHDLDNTQAHLMEFKSE